MITIKQFMELINYRITDGSIYGWQCFGRNAYSIDSWNGDNDNGYSLGIVFDTVTQTVYQVEAHDYRNKRAYRLINPDFIDNIRAESTSRGCDFLEATDEYKFTDLEIEDDWIEKATAIVQGKEYSTDIQIPLNLSDAELITLFKMAHEENITFNALIVEILTNVVNQKKTI